ncbi:hypothetical protein [Rhizobium oryzicola]|uniref:Uncharacterized protein n=1 Tax=Rhizobium oryzicola TaxID=1232668 RepID=A0ABT8SVQ2_9HYPH|nr:hypothetical protein [Rhizobium oryzicola]MDO1582431.1 hypothetical protein [Rhizobium oryzicola]
MVLKIASLKANLARENNGDWIEYPLWEGVEFKVSGFRKPEYQAERDRIFRKLARDHKGKPVPVDVQRAALGPIMAKHLLHDWKGLDEPYSEDRARELLSQPEYRVFYDAVEWCCNEIASVDAQFEDDAAKNSVPRSAGSSKASSQATG